MLLKMKELNIIVGHKGSGKSTVLEIINTLGFYTTELSVQWKYLKHRGFDDKEETGAWNIGVVALFYEHCLIRLPEYPIFVSGFSRPSEVVYLKKRDLPCRVISLQTSEELRHKRILERNRNGEENLTVNNIKEKDLRRLGIADGYTTNDLNGLLALSTFTIDNGGNIAELCRNVEKMLNNFGYII